MGKHRPTIGFFPGVFDLLHPGHVVAFKEAKEHCDILIIGLQSDPTIDRPDKNKPIMTKEERRIILEGIKYVDEIIDYDTEDELNNLDDTLEADIRFIGEDHRDKLFNPIKTKIIYLSRNHNWSSRNLRKRISEYEIYWGRL